MASTKFFVILIFTVQSFAAGPSNRPPGASLHAPASNKLNTTLPVVADTALNTSQFNVSCNPEWGKGIPLRSCVDAINTFAVDHSSLDRVTVGPRGGKMSKEGSKFPFPWRWLSGDGRCLFWIFPSWPLTRGSATPAQLISAALEMTNTCVLRFGGVGGTITQLGTNLTMILNPSDASSTHCSYPATFSEGDNCEYLMQVMPYSNTPQYFVGDRGRLMPKRRDEVHLPYVLSFPDPHRCSLVVDKVDRRTPILLTWSQIWIRMQQIQGMCVRYGLTGYSSGLGELGGVEGLMVNLTARPQKDGARIDEVR
ncbi:MAG: hypothetical protein LQ349_005077 [Xanthoria aureola]|nr:MAG: hypothetical protein LQ349_005077 [Xanthoria aureola]